MDAAPTLRLVVRIAWRNVRRNWRHSAAALGTMAVGFVALALFQGYLDELLRSQLDLIYSRNMIGEVMVRRPGAGSRVARTDPGPYQLDEKEQAFIEEWVAAHQDDVLVRVRNLAIRGMASAGNATAEFWAFGHDIAEGTRARRHWAWSALAGRPIRDGENDAAVLALGLASILGCEPTGPPPELDPRTGVPTAVERPMKCKQDTVTLTANSTRGRMNALEANVVGLTSGGSREFDQRLIWLPLPFAQELADTRNISNVMVALKDPTRAEVLRQDMRAAAQARGLNLQVMDWMDSEPADLLRRGLELLGVYRTLVFLVILVIAGAAVLTTMMKTVRERTREVGTLRSIGYRDRHVLAMFAVESAFLAVHAGVVGLVSALAITAAVNGAHVTYKAGLLAESIPLRVGYAYGAWVTGFLFLSLVAVLAAVLAARKVATMPIAQALTDG